MIAKCVIGIGMIYTAALKDQLPLASVKEQRVVAGVLLGAGALALLLE